MGTRSTLAVAGGTLVLGLIAGCGSSGSAPSAVQQSALSSGATPTVATTTVTPSSSDSGAPASTGPVVVARLNGFQQFQSPSGNIGCEIDKSQARCDIKTKDWTPPPTPSDCPLDYGNGTQVSGNRKGSLTCAGDTALQPHAARLAYGHALQVGPLRCTSSAEGMTCENRVTGHGFFLSRQSYRVF